MMPTAVSEMGLGWCTDCSVAFHKGVGHKCSAAKIGTAKVKDSPKPRPDGSHAENMLANAMRAASWRVLTMREWVDELMAGLAPWAIVRQFPWGLTLDEPRGFKGDFVMPMTKKIIEVDGKAHDMKRKGDVMRRQLADDAGWRIYSVLSEQVRDGTAMGFVTKFVNGELEAKKGTVWTPARK